MFRIFVFFLSLFFSSLVYATLLQQHQRLAGFEQYEEEWVETLDTPVINEVVVPQAVVEVEPIKPLDTLVADTVPVHDIAPVIIQVAEPTLEIKPELNNQPEPIALPTVEIISPSVLIAEPTPVATPKKSTTIFIKGEVLTPAAPAVSVQSETPQPVRAVVSEQSEPIQSPSPIVSTETESPKTQPLIAETERPLTAEIERPVAVAPVTVAPLQINKVGLNNPSVASSALITSFDASEVGVSSTLEQMIQNALAWHPSLRQARSQVLATQEGIDAAKAPYYPQISSGFNTGYRDSTGRDEEAFNVSASQLLYDFGKTSSGVKRANHEHNLEQARLLLSIDQLIEQTATASLEIMRSQEKEQIAKTQMNALTELWELAKDRAQMGASAESDSIQALSRKEAATALLWQLQAQADLWQKQLQSLTGHKEAVRLLTAFPEQLGLQCQNHLLQLEQVPSIRIVEEERGGAQAQLELSDANLYPTISVDAGYDQYLRNRQSYANGRLENRSSDFSVMLNMNMSLFEGGGKMAQKNAALHALQAVDAQKESTVLEVTRGFEESQQKQLLLSHRLRVLLERIGSIERTQELYKDQYIALGTRSLLDLLNTEQEIYQAKSDYIDNKYEMYKAQIACLYYGAQLRQAFDINTLESSEG